MATHTPGVNNYLPPQFVSLKNEILKMSTSYLHLKLNSKIEAILLIAMI
jgi:hypothetical protein